MRLNTGGMGRHGRLRPNKVAFECRCRAGSRGIAGSTRAAAESLANLPVRVSPPPPGNHYHTAHPVPLFKVRGLSRDHPSRSAPSSQNPRRRAENTGRPTVAVLGVGQMGLVCTGLLVGPDTFSAHAGLARRPVNVTMWGHSPEESGRLAQSRKSPRLEGFVLTDDMHVCLRDADAIRNAAVIVSAIPVQYTRDVWTRLRTHVPPRAGVISVAKGIENDTLLRPTQIIADVLRKTKRQ